MNRQIVYCWIIYIVLAIGILGPLLLPGYVLTLDMVFTPQIDAQAFVGRPSFLWYSLLELTTKVLPADLVQKLILFAVVLLGAWGMDRLLRYILKNQITLQLLVFGVGVFLCNPFVYGRFMAGQLAVLLGYVLLPFFVVALLRFLEVSSWRRVMILLLWMSAIAVVSIHTLGLAIIVGLPLIALQIYRHRRNWQWGQQFLLKSLAAFFLFLLVNSYWIMPLLQGHSDLTATIGSFGLEDFRAFATSTVPWGVLGNVLTLQGFWADSANLYLTPQDMYWWWYIPLGLLLFLVMVGIYYGWKTTKGLTVALLIMWIIAVILATGPSGTWFGPVNGWLQSSVPFFAGYREPQKFQAIIALVYAVFATIGVLYGGKHLDQWHRQLAESGGIVALLLPLTCAPLMFWGFHGQLRVSEYPKDWYAINEYFEQHTNGSQRVLALPWHLYMRFGFAGRIIANPLDNFFKPKVIINTDAEMAQAKIDSRDPQTQTIAQLLQTAQSRSDMATRLQSLQISYILLAKEFDYKVYQYLDTQPGLRLLQETPTLKLYKVEPS